MSELISKIEKILKRKSKEERIRYLNLGFFHSTIFHLLIAVVIQLIVIYNIPSTTRIRIVKSKAPIPVFLQDETHEEQKVSIGNLGKDSVKHSPDTSKNLFAGFEIDTSATIQKYEENSLNVSILFPINWVFFDNKVKDFIDGIIFMPGENSDYNPQLSVLIQVVQNKSLFNKLYFDSSFKFNDMEFFIGPPQSTFGQITQTIYLRTKIYKADFQIKCTSPNETEFKKFQPVFFAMVKSFSAG